MTEETITLKEMCAKFYVTPRTLRYYEYIELLFPEKKGRTRLYGSTEFARMKLILRGRRFGFSLEEIRQWLEMYNEHDQREQMEIWVEMSGRQLEELESRKIQLQETIDELRARHQRGLDTLAK
ncbi:MAG: MerR family DNA-binding transcriptional regulator [Rhodobacteraceae bacterium]|nr:MerR family DNA-binding transcriptional regulator [Paracoccaceae bacterium]